MELESEEEQNDMMSQEASSEEGEPRKDAVQGSSTSSTREPAPECDGEANTDVVKVEENVFVSSLYCFMKERGTPIERIPHLGFKQINLWMIYRAVGNLGGYDSVTARRLWKNVYDELGGSPGSTSAATCTRRHYERLVLPFDRHLRGEGDKPLPPGKPRKQYKRSMEVRADKAGGKTKAPPLEEEIPPAAKRKSETADQCGTATQAWTYPSALANLSCSQPKPAAFCTAAYDCSNPALGPRSQSLIDPILLSTGAGISPLEKKKRLAQASLSLPMNLQDDDKDRPTVIQCSLPTSTAKYTSSEDSQGPLSTSSSRSSSPNSLSSEDLPAAREEKPAANRELPPNYVTLVKSGRHYSEDNKSSACIPITAGLAGRDTSHSGLQSLKAEAVKSQSKDSWRPFQKGVGRYSHTCPRSTSSSFVNANWVPASTSSFTKVIPKNVQPVKPTPFPPGYKNYAGRVMQHDHSIPYAKTLHNLPPWLCQAERKERSKPLPPLQLRPHYGASQTPSFLLTGYGRPVRDSLHPPHHLHGYLPSRTRLAPPQVEYLHIPEGLSHSAVFSYPYAFSAWNSQTEYSLAGASPSIYPQKL